MGKKITVIGAGFGGLATASVLAKEGFDVQVIEKNDKAGGRANLWQKDGFTFDMGPSWYWMPEVFEDFYQLFGYQASDFYELKRLSPAYRVFFSQDDYKDIPAEMEALEALFEKMEKGSSKALRDFLAQAAYKYEVGMRDYVFRPSHSITEFFDPRLLVQAFKIQMFQSMRKHVYSYFENEQIRKLLEFPVLFLGATPQETPALYSMMNHADLKLGTWYPMNGMYEIVRVMQKIAEEQGVRFHFNEAVESFDIKNKKVVGLKGAKGTYFETDFVVNNADYQHIDQKVLPEAYRQYSPAYWEKRTMSPSSLLFYVGIDRKVPNLKHHTLFFDEDFDAHAHDIYHDVKWPENPLFYVCAPSVTDPTVAPEGKENLFFLMPLGPGLKDDEEKRAVYFDMMVDRFEKAMDCKIKDAICLKRGFAMKDFEQTYNAFKGNAYGLANTLQQTAILKPKMKSTKLGNLLHTGQLTVPGPGVPPSIISGRVAAAEVAKHFN